jgi:hypothetical protein
MKTTHEHVGIIMEPEKLTVNEKDKIEGEIDFLQKDLLIL